MDPTGNISLPFIPGKIHAAGLTIPGTREDCRLLRENGLVSHPEVSVVGERPKQPTGYGRGSSGSMFRCCNS